MPSDIVHLRVPFRLPNKPLQRTELRPAAERQGVMSKQKRYIFPRSKSDKLWLALIVAPPGVLLIYRVFSSILSFDGRCHGVLESGPECTLLEFIFSELTSTFFLPAMVVITLYWIAAVGVNYFGVRIFKRISKRKETPT